MKNKADELIKIYAREALRSVIMGKLLFSDASTALRKLRKVLLKKNYQYTHGQKKLPIDNG